MRAPAIIAVFLVCCSSPTLTQEPAPLQAYNVREAYRIYSLLLPHEDSYGFAQDKVVIREETVPRLQRLDAWPTGPEKCLYPDAARQFKDAIADYNHVNQKQWLLQRNFEIDKPYEIVSSDALNGFFKQSGWDGFYKRYPRSGGYVIFSAVGFNADMSQAIVYSGSSCGSLCGRWSFHLLEKADGKWKEVRGVSCQEVS